MTHAFVELGGSRAAVKGVTISRSIDAFVGSASLVLPFVPLAPLTPGASVVVTMTGDGPTEVQLRGYVDMVSGSSGANGGELQLDCRDVTADMVDGRPIDAQWSWYTRASLLDVARAVAEPYGLEVVDRVGAAELELPVFVAQPGETAYELLERAARLHGVLISTTPEGEILLGRPERERVGVTLRTGRGGNVTRYAWRHDHSQRYRRLQVLGVGSLAVISPGPSGRPEGVAEDLAIRATREAVVVSSGDLWGDQLNALARWTSSVARARGASLTVDVPSLRVSAGGPVWRPGMLVPVEVEELALEGEYLIAAVELTYDVEGERVTLGLATPDAYEVDPTEAARLRRGSAEALIEA